MTEYSKKTTKLYAQRISDGKFFSEDYNGRYHWTTNPVEPVTTWTYLNDYDFPEPCELVEMEIITTIRPTGQKTKDIYFEGVHINSVKKKIGKVDGTPFA